MAFNYEYPYTDAQRYNDDWLINKVKGLAMDWLKTSGEWTETQEAWEELKRYITDYFNNLDVQEEINEKLEAMKADGSLFNIIKPLFGEYQQAIDVLSARMDTFTALGDDATTGDSELADIRVDYTGHTWPNAGDAFREVTRRLSSEIEEIGIEVDNLIKEICNEYSLSNDSNLIDSPPSPYIMFFDEPTYLYSFKPYFSTNSGTFRILVCKTVSGNPIADGEKVGGITNVEYNVGDTAIINTNLSKDMCLLVIPNNDNSLKIVNGTECPVNALIGGFDMSDNSLSNIDVMRSHYRLGGEFTFVKVKNTLIVSADGLGDFETLNEAVSYFKNHGFSSGVIHLKEGVYEEVVNIQNTLDITIIGDNQDRCIIISKSGKYYDSPMFVCGNFELRNLTFKMTLENVGDWVPSYTSQTEYPGYAIHIDGQSRDTNSIAYGRVSNCTMYSEAFPACGMGANQNQYVIFENCRFVRNCTNDNFKRDTHQGAFIGHSGDGVNQNLIIKDCVFISNYGASGNIRTDVGNPEHFTLECINNTLYSSENGLNSFDYTKGNSVLSPLSHGNTAENLNA